jgi:hypothetical protein
MAVLDVLHEELDLAAAAFGEPAERDRLASADRFQRDLRMAEEHRRGLVQEVSRLEVERDSMRRELAAAAQEHDDLAARLRRDEDSVAALSARVSGLLTSWSWKITAPLRQVVERTATIRGSRQGARRASAADTDRYDSS